MLAGVLSIVPDVADHVDNDHGEPAEHGDEHGHVRGSLTHAAEVDTGVQDLEQRLAHVLLPWGRVAGDVLDRVGVQPRLPQHLLQGTLAVPGVVGQPELGVERQQGLLGDAADAVAGEVEGTQPSSHPFESRPVDLLNGVPGEIEFLQVGEVPEGIAGDPGDAVSVQLEEHRVFGDVLGDLLQVPGAAEDGLRPCPLRALAARGAGAAPGDAQQQTKESLGNAGRRRGGDGHLAPGQLDMAAGDSPVAAAAPGQQGGSSALLRSLSHCWRKAVGGGDATRHYFLERRRRLGCDVPWQSGERLGSGAWKIRVG